MSLTEVLDGGVDGVAAVKEAADEPGANEAAGARHADEEAAGVPGCRHFVAPALVAWPARLPAHGITGVATLANQRHESARGKRRSSVRRSGLRCLARQAAPRSQSIAATHRCVMLLKDLATRRWRDVPTTSKAAVSLSSPLAEPEDAGATAEGAFEGGTEEDVVISLECNTFSMTDGA